MLGLGGALTVMFLKALPAIVVDSTKKKAVFNFKQIRLLSFCAAIFHRKSPGHLNQSLEIDHWEIFVLPDQMLRS